MMATVLRRSRCGDRSWSDRTLSTEHGAALDVDTAEPKLSRLPRPAGAAEFEEEDQALGQGPVQVAVCELAVAVPGWVVALGPLDHDEVQLSVMDGPDGERECGVVDQDIRDVPGGHPTRTLLLPVLLLVETFDRRGED